MDPRPDTPAEPRGATLGVFLVALISTAYFFNGGGQNQNANFDLARALVEQGSIRIDDYRDNTIDVSFAGGHFYSNKAPGVSFLAAIPYAAIHAIMGRAPESVPHIVIAAELGLGSMDLKKAAIRRISLKV